MYRYYTNILPLVLMTFVLCVFNVKTAQAQDPQFSQFFSTRLYVNPAFTGNTNHTRMSAQFRRQWALLGGYTTSGFYVDHNLHGVNSGLGISVVRDQQVMNALSLTKYSAMYSYKFPVSRKAAGRFGLAASYNTFRVDLNQFVFTDQLLTGSAQTSDDYFLPVSRYFNFSSGGVVYTDKYWGGVSVSNMSRLRDPQLATPMPVRYSVHGGAIIPLNKNIKGVFSKSFSVAVHYKAQKLYDQVDFGAYYRVQNFLIGVWYRGLEGLKDNETLQANRDAVVLVVGGVLEGSRLSYSYDITTSRLYNHSGGTHEVSLQYELWKNLKRRKKKYSQLAIPCPDFGGPGWQLGKDD